jgi:hypothetical protein
MVGRVADVVPSTDHEGRWLVTFSEYAEIDVPDVWKGGRNPVSYTMLKDLGVTLDGVKFKPMPAKGGGAAQNAHVSPPSPPATLTIAEARKSLVAEQTFGVSPEAVEITIRG